MTKRKTKSEFIEKARSVHGDRYDYSKVTYIDNRTKIIIICPEHGEFKQRPDNHLSGRRCTKCRGIFLSELFRGTNEQFITKAREVHGDKYDYSKCLYENSQSKLIIVCSKHGEFKQAPADHLFGRGCAKCAGKNKTTNEFIEQAKGIHGDNYDYSKVIYIKNSKKIVITCQEHGDFEQVPASHLNGNGCPHCSGNIQLTTEIFIEKAKKIHSDRYDYSKVEYKSMHNKVTITCLEHGEFNQTPDSHVNQSSGCPSCYKGGGYDPEKDGFVYVLRSVDHTQDIIKIGISNMPKRRFKDLSRETPFAFNVIECFEVVGQQAQEIERSAHMLGGSANLTGFDGATEWFEHDTELIAKVRRMCLSNQKKPNTNVGLDILLV